MTTTLTAIGFGCEFVYKIERQTHPDRPQTLVDACFYTTCLLSPAPGAGTLGPLLDEHSLRTEVELTSAAIAKYASRAPDDLVLAPTRSALAFPFELAVVSATTVAPLTHGTESEQRAAAQFVCAALRGDPEMLGASQGSIPVGNPQAAIYAMDFLLNETRLMFEDATKDRPSSEECSDFLAMLVRVGWPSGETVKQYTAFATAARRSIDMSDEGVMRAVARSLAHIDADFGITAAWTAAEPEPIPAEIATAVTGSIFAAENVPGVGWVVVGSLGENTYDMGQISAVFDPGGNDKYEWPSMHLGAQAIVDLAGNDRYVGGAQQGPAAGLFGLSLVNDFAGDDEYSGESFACGAGMFGVGILIDRAGNDRYRTGAWSLGAGICGAGFVFDLDGHDDYQSSIFSQGLGGPLGLGVLVDRVGNDLYRVDGAYPGADRVPTVSLAMSQGVGFGARGLIAGGIGVLADLDGNDRFEGGEFSQGGGYYFGMGILFDASGSDLYRGSHYSQGFTAHQSVGALIDLNGDDTYWAMISASQGAAWDTSVSLLLDAAGNDTYRGGALSQGSAAEQSIAMLCDLDGSDHYLALGPFAQGESGDNAYHFKDTKARSFSVLIDDGDGEDFFSTGRPHPGVTRTGPNPSDGAPASAPLFGLMIDKPALRSSTPAR